MSKVAAYLQEHLSGEVMTSADVRGYFSTDGSIFQIMPSIIVYPRNENDVRKAVRFSWQLAERGRTIPITARGLGTDQSGAAIGAGILLVFPAHLNRILELDSKTGTVVVEPGTNYGKLQQSLHTHNRFLPPFPASLEYSTVGGAIANNAGGEKSFKYGATRDFVKSLKVVLANGEAIEAKRISRRELNKKLGLATFEGEIYRNLDVLIEENRELIQKTVLGVSKNSSGYSLADVKRRDGSFDLTPLMVGSQGTLGIVTEATLKTQPHNPSTTLIAAFCDDINVAEEVVSELRGLADKPSAIELVDEHLLNYVHSQNPNQLKGVLEPPFPKIVLLIEFDDQNERTQKRMAKKTIKIMNRYQLNYQLETDPRAKDELWKIRHSVAAVLAYPKGNARALPIIEDGIVPPEQFGQYLNQLSALFKSYNLDVAVWGHAGDANLHMQPFLDLSQVGDRQKIFRLLDDYFNLIVSLGGSLSGEHGDGRLRGPYLAKVYGDDVYELFQRVKQIFDPYGILNPGVKIDASLEANKSILRNSYTTGKYDHMPRS
ncbi:MAG TPA: FAD-binding oxidoreductase [Patescibacteria group bacterium]|nr:FAD-binding oxidoreductase [Patescibacteria group bacterium]